MSLTGFDRIAGEYPALRQEVRRLEAFLSNRGPGELIDEESVVDFTEIDPPVVRELLEALAKAGGIALRKCWVCDSCGAAGEEAGSEGPLVDCEECGHSNDVRCTETGERWSLLKEIPGRSHAEETKVNDHSNVLSDQEMQLHHKMVPWKALRQEEYLVDAPKLDASARERALQYLEKYGLALIRWHAEEPTPARLQSLEEWIGPARQRQNDFPGKVKSILPSSTAPPTTGDSAKELPHHVDGTQDPRTPAILAFQYIQGGSWGAESTFVDMAAALASLPQKDLERVLERLAMSGIGSCTKVKGAWKGEWKGPIVRVERGNAVAIRLREDDLLKVVPEYASEFVLLKDCLRNWATTNKTRLTPREGDIIVFDNWRVLHGRAAVGGRAQRHHDRMWIDDLLREHRAKYLLGIRPLSNAMLATMEHNNRR